MTTSLPPKHWAMLAVELDTLDPLSDIGWPAIGQPKLDGVRACWNGHILFSRQSKIFPEIAIPHIYSKLRFWSQTNPGIILDGELYAYGIPFQDIAGMVSINRTCTSVHAKHLDFHAFDLISKTTTEQRQITLSKCYAPWVAVCELRSPTDIDLYTNRFYEAGFEGLMIRQKGCPYYAGRTEYLIKVKPWQYDNAIIIDFLEGQGKYIGILGALKVRLPSNKTFKVSGGLTDAQRKHIWENKSLYHTKSIGVRYRELSNTGVPLKPQIVALPIGLT